MPTFNGRYEDFQGELFGDWALIEYRVKYKTRPKFKVLTLTITSVRDENYIPVIRDFSRENYRLLKILNRENRLEKDIYENRNH